MTKIVGVTHGASDLFSGNLSLSPSKEFLRYLSQFPKGTKVGLETLSEDDWDYVREDIFNRGSDNYEILSNSERDPPHFSLSDDFYWNSLRNFCVGRDFKVVYLEDRNIWIEYNKSVIKSALLNARIHDKVLFHNNGESDLHYSRKLVRCNESNNRLSLKSEKIHKIDRDKEILDAIRKSGVDLAIVGASHSDYWYNNLDILERTKEIYFEEYVTDIAEATPSGNIRTIFRKNPIPSPKIVFAREGLERSIRLYETGKISNGSIPDYVGTWKLTHPSQGFFEVFIEKIDGTKISGQIIDCLGDSFFEGEINENEFDIIKTYDSIRSLNGSLDVRYKGKRCRNEIYGYYAIPGSGGEQFYMTSLLQKNPINLADRLSEVFLEEREVFREIADSIRSSL